jgi:hypothetical protein
MGDQKQLLINTIKEWVSINSKEVALQKQLKELKTSKKQLSDSLIKVMENNEIDRFDINNGKLLYKKNKVKAPINKDYLLKMLDDYFKDNPEIDTSHVSEFLLENRPIKEKSILVIKQNK